MELSNVDAVIHEYRLPFRTELGNSTKIDVFSGRLLHLALQHGGIVLWAAVDPHRGPTPMTFHLVGTGGRVDSAWHPFGSVMAGAAAFHVFSESKTIRVSGGLGEPSPGPRPGPTK